MNRFTGKHPAWFVLILVLLLTSVLRFGMLEVPLERDEGEYAYGGQLILQGLPVYENLHSMKLPGIYFAYALLLKLFGQTHAGIHFGLLLINSCTIILIFFLALRLLDPLAASVAAASFAVLSISPAVHGVFANAEHFVVLPVVAGAIILIRAIDKGRLSLLLISGVLFGLGFIIKQHGIMFVAFGGCYLLSDSLKHSRMGRKTLLQLFAYSAGAVAPYGFLCLFMVVTGSFEKFWFWTFEYASIYASHMPIQAAWGCFKFSAIPMAKRMYPIWILAGMGMIAQIYYKPFRNSSSFIFQFTLFSILAVVPGFYFRQHYFIFVLPAAAMLSGVAISTFVQLFSSHRFQAIKHGVAIVLATICIFVSVYHQRDFLFNMTPVQASRYIYKNNPFPESIEIARYIKECSKKGDRIAVLGSEPQIYFYAKRLSASPYIYMYPLVENHDFSLQMQKEMINDIESIRPKFLVNISIKTSWLAQPDSYDLIFEWLKKYQAKYYTVVGLVDISPEKTEYQWAPNILKPPGPSFCAVLRRKIGL